MARFRGDQLDVEQRRVEAEELDGAEHIEQFEPLEQDNADATFRFGHAVILAGRSRAASSSAEIVEAQIGYAEIGQGAMLPVTPATKSLSSFRSLALLRCA